MTELQVKNKVGIFLIISHFMIILLIIILYFLGGFLFEEMTTSVSLVAPFFASYTTIILKFIITNKNILKDHSKNVSPTFRLVAFLVPSFFILFIGTLVIIKAFNGFAKFDDFKILLAVSETTFGIYVGQLVFSLFEDPDTKRDGGL